jgi:hypothetical protein
VARTGFSAGAPAAGEHRYVGRFTVVHADGTIEVRGILDSGTTEVQRTTTPSPDPWSLGLRARAGQLLMYRATDGYGRLTSVERDGAVRLNRRQDTNAGFTMGTGLEDGWLFLYMSDGYAGSMHLDEEGSYIGGVGYNESRFVNRGYDRIAHAGARRLLLYGSSSGKSMLITLGSAGEMAVSGRPQLPTGWSVLAPTARRFMLGVDLAGKASVLQSTDADVVQIGIVHVGPGHYTSAAPYARGTVIIDGRSGSGRVIEIGADGSIGRITSFQAAPGAFVTAAD